MGICTTISHATGLLPACLFDKRLEKKRYGFYSKRPGEIGIHMCVRAQANIITWPAAAAAYRVRGGLLPKLVDLPQYNWLRLTSLLGLGRVS